MTMTAMRRRQSRLLPLVIFLHGSPTAALKLAVVSKIIVDTISGKQRPGGGGVQAACGASLADSSAGISLHAPVGTDFDFTLLEPLSEYDVDISSVQTLDAVATTPGEIISYEDEKMNFEPVGWDGWETLCAWEPPELSTSSPEAMHVIIEGAGAGEVRSVFGACESAQNTGQQLPCVGVEPVAHEVRKSTIDGVCNLTRLATCCSPDLATAVCMRDVAGSMDVDAIRRPSEVGLRVLDTIRSDNTELLELSAALFDALCMQPGACLAIRDGRFGSYVYTRPAPGAPMYQWLTLSRDFEWLAKAPAVSIDDVADPTGAGNAYAGALCVQLASGSELVDAVAVATAVGGAFCRAAEAVPTSPEAVRTWIIEASAEVRAGMREVVCPIEEP